MSTPPVEDVLLHTSSALTLQFISELTQVSRRYSFHHTFCTLSESLDLYCHPEFWIAVSCSDKCVVRMAIVCLH